MILGFVFDLSLLHPLDDRSKCLKNLIHYLLLRVTIDYDWLVASLENP